MRLAQRGAREKTPRTIESIGLRELSNRQDHRLAGRGFERGCWVTRSQKLSVFTGLTRVENYAQAITLCKSAREPSEKPRKVKRRILPDRDGEKIQDTGRSRGGVRMRATSTCHIW